MQCLTTDTTAPPRWRLRSAGQVGLPSDRLGGLEGQLSEVLAGLIQGGGFGGGVKPVTAAGLLAGGGNMPQHPLQEVRQLEGQAAQRLALAFVHAIAVREVAEAHLLPVQTEDLPVAERAAAHIAAQVGQQPPAVLIAGFQPNIPFLAAQLVQAAVPGSFGAGGIRLQSTVAQPLPQQCQKLAAKQRHHDPRREEATAPG